MVKVNFALIAVAVIAIALLTNFFTSGSIISTGLVQSVSPLQPHNSQQAFLITMLGSGSADALDAEVSTVRNPNWNANDNLGITVQKTDDRYQFTLSERYGSNDAIYKIAEERVCVGLNPLDPNACNYDTLVGAKAPWMGLSSDLYSGFKQWCNSFGNNRFTASTGTTLSPRFVCYRLDRQYIIGDFNYVGTNYKPSVLVSALTYDKNTQPWTGNGEYKKIAEVKLSDSIPSGNLLTTDGELLGEATITSMAPTFTTPEGLSTSVKALSVPSSPRNWQLVGGDVDGIYASITGVGVTNPGSLQNCLASAKTNSGVVSTILFGVQNYEYYYQSQLAACINSYNAKVDNITNLAPLRGNLAVAQKNLSAINTAGTFTIKNDFSIPSLTLWIYADKVGVVTTSNSKPLYASCSNIDNFGSGGSGVLQARVAGTESGILKWSATCTAPATLSVQSGTIYTGIAGADLPLQFNTGGTLGTSTCTITATDINNQNPKVGTCTIGVVVCNDPIPAGCVRKPIAGSPCNIDCTVPPEICSDGTVLGKCNSLNQRCVRSGNSLVLNPDASCVTPPPPPNNTTCLPIVQKKATSVVGAFCLLPGWCFGGTTVQTCVWDFPVLAAGLLIIAAILLGMKKEKYAKVVGIAGLLLLGLSFVADNAVVLALGGAGIFLVAAVVAVAYVALRLHLI